MLTAVIIDDEEDAIAVISELLRNFTSTPVKVVGTAGNLDEGIKVISATKPDILFLDIDMPNKSGMEIYNYFPEPSFKVIFVTAYNQYAIEALKNAASDYLLKPVDFVELSNALKKISLQLKRDQRLHELEDKIQQLTASDMEGKNIVLDVDDGFLVENTKNIEYCYADDNYSVIVTFLGKKIPVTRTLKSLEELLPSGQFFRTHKSYLVNVFYIRKYVKASEHYVLLRSGVRIPVSIRKSYLISSEIKRILHN